CCSSGQRHREPDRQTWKKRGPGCASERVYEILNPRCEENMKGAPDNKDRFVIIMAGGRGERFWPVSREKTPKQLIPLLGKRSFLQQAVDRVAPLVPMKNIIVITNEVQ